MFKELGEFIDNIGDKIVDTLSPQINGLIVRHNHDATFLDDVKEVNVEDLPEEVKELINKDNEGIID